MSKNVKEDDYIYIKNIENMKKFFETDLYKSLKEKSDIKNEIKKFYKDPDNTDRALYKTVYETLKQNIQKKDINKKYELNINLKNCKLYMNGIALSLDCVIGWKSIIDVCIVESIDLKDKFIKAYEITRNPEYAGHLIWPAHTIPTINTERFQQFNDRVDYTLFDIKNYFEKREELKVFELIENLKTFKFGDVFLSNTLRWLNQFNDFKEFIDIMNLNCWCNKDYEVKDISKNDGTTIKSYLGNERADYPITIDYINNLLEIISDGKEKNVLSK